MINWTAHNHERFVSSSGMAVHCLMNSIRKFDLAGHKCQELDRCKFKCMCVSDNKQKRKINLVNTDEGGDLKENGDLKVYDSYGPSP